MAIPKTNKAYLLKHRRDVVELLSSCQHSSSCVLITTTMIIKHKMHLLTKSLLLYLYLCFSNNIYLLISISDV